MSRERTQIHRHPERGRYDEAAIHAILDQGFICHVGIVTEGQPYVLPVLYARSGGTIYLHGSPVSRLHGQLAGGAPLCLTVTHVDGIVLARSALHHSLNFRSVVILGHGRVVNGTEEKQEALRLIVEQTIPGRSEEVRGPSAGEMAATMVIAVTIEEASAKVRTGPPVDAPADRDLDVWAGVLPLALRSLAPVPDEDLSPAAILPNSVRHYSDRDG